MGRKKIFPAGDVFNPLQRMLGTYLRVERSKLGYSSAEVAARLGLTDTYFRLAESGRAALNQSLVFKVIEVFADSTAPTHDPRTISFNRFALYMVGMHWVGAEMALPKYRPKEAARLAMEHLASRVTDFQEFYERTKQYFDLKEDSREQKIFLEEVAAAEVADFLRFEAYGREDENAWSQGILNILDLPTLNMDIVLDLKQALTGRSFVHTADVASKWEAQRTSQFRNVRGVYRHCNIIVNPANLDEFHFEYLSEERFSTVRMIFVEADANAAALKREFIRLLDAGRKAKTSLEPLKPKEAEKIHFVCLSDDERRQHSQNLEQLLRRESADRRTSGEHQAYWSFEAHSGLHIGFVGLLDSNPESTRNLNLRDSFRKTSIFDRLWSDVLTTHGR
jgi:transcriptional regulator with XRE-family HTH domain